VVQEAAKKDNLNFKADYVPLWEGDSRWPGDYCVLPAAERIKRDSELKTLVPRKKVPEQFRDLLYAEWDRGGVVRFAVLPEANDHIIVRDRIGGNREVSKLDDSRSANS